MVPSVHLLVIFDFALSDAGLVAEIASELRSTAGYALDRLLLKN